MGILRMFKKAETGKLMIVFLLLFVLIVIFTPLKTLNKFWNVYIEVLFYTGIYVFFFKLFKKDVYYKHLKYFVIIYSVVWFMFIFSFGKDFLYGYEIKNPKLVVMKKGNFTYQFTYRTKKTTSGIRFGKPNGIRFLINNKTYYSTCSEKLADDRICNFLKEYMNDVQEINGRYISRNDNEAHLFVIDSINYNDNNQNKKTINFNMEQKIRDSQIRINVARITFFLTYLFFGYIFIKSRYLKKCESLT